MSTLETLEGRSESPVNPAYTIQFPSVSHTILSIVAPPNSDLSSLMGKQNSEAAVLHSSIALLQERFRQLQRVKELREEREQIKALTDAGRRSPSSCYEQQQQQELPATSKWFIHPDLIHPSRPLSSGPSSSLRSRDEHNEIQNFETPLYMRQPRASVQISNGYNEGDVDTSLHL